MRKYVIFACAILISAPSFAEGTRPQQLLTRMFAAIEQNVFAKGYLDKGQMAVSGSIAVTTPPSTVSRKLQMLTTNLSFSFGLNGTILADRTCKLSFSGDMGDAVLCRMPTREILYSTDFNSYAISNHGVSSRNTNFHSYFLGYLNSIKGDFLTSGRWSFQKENDVVYGADKCYVIRVATHFSESERRNARARVQKLDDLLTFWKRGIVTFTIRKSDFMPTRIEYENPVQNIHSEITIAYAGQDRRPVRLDVSGDAAGVQGSGQASVSYSADNTFKSVSLQFDNALGQSVSLDLDMEFAKGDGKSAISFLPPMGAQRMTSDNLKLLMMTNVAGSLLRMQQAGINIKTIRF